METEKLVNEEPDFRKGKLELVGGPIPLEKAKLWINNYQKINARTTTSHFFGKKVISKILNQKGCYGIRIFYALDDRGHKQLILSGVDEHGNDQRSDNEFDYHDQSWPCPETKGCP